MPKTIRLNVRFSTEDTQDVPLMEWLDTVPRRRRSAALKTMAYNQLVKQSKNSTGRRANPEPPIRRSKQQRSANGPLVEALSIAEIQQRIRRGLARKG